ncbi:MAG: hypothetical protein K2K89_04920 [Ruminococcus sp.]|nr:hypothetical protein [Ruminococcus sp.]
MKKRIISVLAFSIVAAICVTASSLSTSAVGDINGGTHSYYGLASATYTYSDFGISTSWRSKKVGDLVRTNSNTGNSFDAGEVTAYYNYNIGSGDKAYTSVDNHLYNCYYDCLVNSNGSTEYSNTVYGGPVTSPTLNGIGTGNGVYFRGTTYWS